MTVWQYLNDNPMVPMLCFMALFIVIFIINKGYSLTFGKLSIKRNNSENIEDLKKTIESLKDENKKYLDEIKTLKSDYYKVLEKLKSIEIKLENSVLINKRKLLSIEYERLYYICIEKQMKKTRETTELSTIEQLQHYKEVFNFSETDKDYINYSTVVRSIGEHVNKISYKLLRENHYDYFEVANGNFDRNTWTAKQEKKWFDYKEQKKIYMWSEAMNIMKQNFEVFNFNTTTPDDIKQKARPKFYEIYSKYFDMSLDYHLECDLQKERDIIEFMKNYGIEKDLRDILT